MMRRALLSASQLAVRLFEEMLPRSTKVLAVVGAWRRKITLAFLAFVIPIAGIAYTVPATAQSVGTFTFDSGSCREDTQETVYVTLFGTVFRLPMDHLHRISALHPTDAHLVPPPQDPDEPLGCPENPLPGSMFVVSVPAPDSMTFSTPENANIRFRDGIIPVRRLAIRAAPANFFGMQHSYQGLAARSCDIGVVRVINPHLRECLIEPRDNIYPIEQWGGDYITNPSIYSVPFGGPFVVHCLSSRPVRNCQVSYKLHATVNIDYGIDLRFVHPDQFIQVDQAIRDRLESWRVLTPTSEAP